MRTMFLRVLFIGSTADAESIAAILRESGIDLDCTIASTAEAVERVLAGDDSWSAVVANDVVEGWSGFDALRLVREHDADVPFILLAATAGEEVAVEAMRAGATDYIVKDRLGRLAPALEREVRDAATRRERTHLFAELRRNKERFRVTFDKAPIGIATVSPGALFSTVNERFARIVGYTRRELIGRRFSDIVHPDEVPDAEARQAAFHEGVRAKMEIERRLRHKDGRTVWVNATLTPIFGSDDELEQIIALIHDITPHRLATQRVELLARLLDSVEQAVMATDVEGRITYWNRYAEELYGWRIGEVRGKHVLDVTAAPFVRAAADETMDRLREGESWSGESLMLRRDGTTFPAWVVAAPILGLADNITGIVAVSHDISRLKRAEQQSRRYGVQQAAAANLGSLALRGAPLDTLFREAATFVREVLSVDFCEVVKADGTQRMVIVAGAGWEEGVVGAERAGGPRSVAEVTIRERAPLVTRDVTSDPRIAPIAMLRRHGVRGAAAIPIGAAGEPWGYIGAYSREERLFTDSDIDFLRTVSTVLGQSIERVRADVEVRIRAAQQSAIAELGMVAFSTVDQHTLDRACELAQNALGVEYALLHERKDGRLVVCAAPSWPEHLGNVTPIGAGTQSGMAASTRVPVVVGDYRTDRRFREPARALAERDGVRSGLSVPIAGARSFFGVLSIYSGEPRNFTEADVHFLQSLANTLAEAMEREEATRALVTSEQRYRSVVEGASEIIFDVDREGTICALNRAFETITGHSREAFVGRHFSEF
ncbi:MAG TPA: PAS domain S-box protein, partial [Thermoanaerobaculia bacterium]|nr:PAS domain S-box protein [Thermoanaerobaculia bacterium]